MLNEKYIVNENFFKIVQVRKLSFLFELFLFSSLSFCLIKSLLYTVFKEKVLYFSSSSSSSSVEFSFFRAEFFYL